MIEVLIIVIRAKHAECAVVRTYDGSGQRCVTHNFVPLQQQFAEVVRNLLYMVAAVHSVLQGKLTMHKAVSPLVRSLLATAFVSASLAMQAHAAPIPPATTGGIDLVSGGTSITAAFLFADAADDSDLDIAINAGGASFLFSNSNAVTANASAVGAMVSFPTSVGDLLTFTLNDLSVPNGWPTGVGSTNVAYVMSSDVGTIEAALGIDLSAAGEAALLALAALGDVTVIAFEDRPLNTSDRDYNDLVFAFVGVSINQIPEPGSLALLGAGLIAAGVLRRRR